MGMFSIYCRFAFVTFGSVEEVDCAIEEKQGSELGDNALFLDHAEQKRTFEKRRGEHHLDLHFMLDTVDGAMSSVGTMYQVLFLIIIPVDDSPHGGYIGDLRTYVLSRSPGHQV